jgi:hypothetical protein
MPDNPSERVAEAARALRAKNPSLRPEQAQHLARQADPQLDREYVAWHRSVSRPAGEQSREHERRGRTALAMGSLTDAERERLGRLVRGGAKPIDAKRLILAERGAR